MVHSLKDLRKKNIDLLRAYWHSGLTEGAFMLKVEKMLLVGRPNLLSYKERLEYYEKKLNRYNKENGISIFSEIFKNNC